MRIEQASIENPRFREMQVHAKAKNIEAAELRRRLGFEGEVTDEFFPGVHQPCEVYSCRIGDAFVFGILRGIEGDAAGEVAVWTIRMDQISLVALAMDLPDGWFSWRNEPDAESLRPWQVVRQDDNGNRFVMARFAEECDARLYVRLTDDRIGAHKQSCFVERTT